MRFAIFLLLVLVGCTPTPTITDAGVAKVDAPASIDEIVVDAEAPLPPKIDPRTSQQIALAACKGANGWRCPKIKQPLTASSATPIVPPSLTIPNWYVDPSNLLGCASDSNSGTAATCTGGCTGSACTSGVGPLLTWSEMIVHRWGARNPTLVSTTGVTTIHVLSSQPSSTTDVIGWLEPDAPNAMFEILGTLQPVGSTFNCGTITQINRSTSGNDFEVGSMPVAAAATQILFDSTAQSYCVVDSVSIGTATCTSPQAAAGLTTPTNTILTTTFVADGAAWTSGDTCQLYTTPTLYIDELSPRVGTLTAANSTPGMIWIQGINIGDASGINGDSRVTFRPAGQWVMSLVTANAALDMTDLGGPTVSLVNGPQGLDNVATCSFLGAGRYSGGIVFWGSLVNSGPNAIQPLFEDRVVFTHDTILHKAPNMIGPISAYNVHFPDTNSPTLEEGNFFMRAGVANGAIWGAATIIVFANGHIVNRTGGTWTNNFLIASKVTSALLTTASAYSQTTGLWDAGITINAADIDNAVTAGGNGLVDPISGAGYSN